MFFYPAPVPPHARRAFADCPPCIREVLAHGNRTCPICRTGEQAVREGTAPRCCAVPTPTHVLTGPAGMSCSHPLLAIVLSPLSCAAALREQDLFDAVSEEEARLNAAVRSATDGANADFGAKVGLR